MKKLAFTILTLGFASFASAQPKPPAPAAAPAAAPAGMPDMTKMGPMSRPVKKADKKGVDEMYKSMEEAMTKGDINAFVENVDFPVLMMTDDSTGKETHVEMNKETFISAMKPMFAPHPDMKMGQKHNATFLSDTMAVSVEDNSMKGKMKGEWKSTSLLVNKDGKWKVKQMTEAGWGDMAKAMGTGAPGTKPAAAPMAPPAPGKAPAAPAKK